MPAVLITGPAVTQDSPFLLSVAVTIASNQFAYPQMDGQAELVWLVKHRNGTWDGKMNISFWAGLSNNNKWRWWV